MQWMGRAAVWEYHVIESLVLRNNTAAGSVWVFH